MNHMQPHEQRAENNYVYRFDGEASIGFRRCIEVQSVSVVNLEPDSGAGIGVDSPYCSRGYSMHPHLTPGDRS